MIATMNTGRSLSTQICNILIVGVITFISMLSCAWLAHDTVVILYLSVLLVII